MVTLINVCGSARSGSTILDLMLGNSPDAFSCGEVVAWFRPWREHHFEIACVCQQAPCPVWEKLKNFPPKLFHRSLSRELNVHFVIDSSKDLAWVIDNQKWAADSGMRVLNLLIWKDPVNLAYSHWKRGLGLHYWRRQFVGYYGKFLAVGLPFQSVCYHDLVANPVLKLERICKVVDMPYFEGKERFWEKQHHLLFGSGGVRKQLEVGSSSIRAKEEFSPDFKVHLRELRDEIRNDTKIQEIMRLLQNSEVDLIDSQSFQNQDRVRRSIYPLWYYVRRIRKFYRRYFPEKGFPLQ